MNYSTDQQRTIIQAATQQAILFYAERYSRRAHRDWLAEDEAVAMRLAAIDSWKRIPRDAKIALEDLFDEVQMMLAGRPLSQVLEASMPSMAKIADKVAEVNEALQRQQGLMVPDNRIVVPT